MGKVDNIGNTVIISRMLIRRRLSCRRCMMRNNVRVARVQRCRKDHRRRVVYVLVNERPSDLITFR